MRSCGVDRGLDVLGEAPVAFDPSEEAFDHPPSRQDDEANLTGEFSDDFDADAGRGMDTVVIISGIGEQLVEKREDRSESLQERPSVSRSYTLAG